MKPLYFLCINGLNEYESYSINELKQIAKEIKKTLIFNNELVNELFIGMYSIDYLDI